MSLNLCIFLHLTWFTECFEDHLEGQQVRGAEKLNRLNKTGYYLSQHIGSLRKMLYPDLYKSKLFLF